MARTTALPILLGSACHEVRAFEKVQKAVRRRVTAMEMPGALRSSNKMPESATASTRIFYQRVPGTDGARHAFRL